MKLTTEEIVVLLVAIRFYAADWVETEDLFDPQITEEILDAVAQKLEKEIKSDEELKKWFKNLYNKIADGLKNE